MKVFNTLGSHPLIILTALVWWHILLIAIISTVNGRNKYGKLVTIDFVLAVFNYRCGMARSVSCSSWHRAVSKGLCQLGA